MGTTVAGSQIARLWNPLNGIGLVIIGTAAITTIFSARNGAGIDTHKVMSDGSVTQSGSLLAKSGATTTFYFNPTTTRVGVHTQTPKTEFDVVGTMSGDALKVSRSFSGAGLTDCDTGSTSKLLWDSSTGRFSCGTDQNTPTTYTAGQGLALTSTAFNTNATLTGTLLKFTTATGSLARFQTLSGSLVKANVTLASSGGLVWEGAASGATMTISGQFDGVGLSSCSNGSTSKLLWSSATKRFSCGTDTDTNTTYTAGQGLTLTATSFKLSPSFSGSVIQATTTLASSGGLVWEGTGSGSALYAGTLGVGIGSVDSGLKLEIAGTASGRTIYGQQSLRSSGSLVWEGAASGSTIYIGGSLQGIGLADCDTGATSKLLWDVTTGRFSCGTDQNSAGSYTAGQGLSLATSSFKLNTTITGSLVQVSTTLASSGGLVWEGTASGSTAYVGSLFVGKPSAKAKLDVLGTISGSLIAQYGAANNFFAGSLGLGKTPTTKLEVVGTISGSLIKGTTISGSLVRAEQLSKRRFELVVFATGSTITTGSGKLFFTIPDDMSGYLLETAHLAVGKAGVTNTTSVQIRDPEKNYRKMFSTVLSIDSTESGSNTAATPYVINASNRDVGSYDRLMIDIPQVSTTAPKGGMVLTLKFFKP